MEQNQYDAMELQGHGSQFHYSPEDPEAPIRMQHNDGQVVNMDPAAIAAEGMAFSGQYMAPNGPPMASHSIADQERGMDCNKMTKTQLKEQRMNEDSGLPSNLGEANRVKALESKVESMSTGIGQILNHLNGQSSPESPASSEPIGGSPVSLAVPTTAIPGPAATVRQPSPQPIVSDESSLLENKQPKQRQVTLKDGRKISVPVNTPQGMPMSLGPATAATDAPVPLDEDNVDSDDPWDDPIQLIEEPEAPPVPNDPVADPGLERLVHLIQEVNQFMVANDVHRFWRRHLSRNLHRHLGYNGWPGGLQQEFDQRFKSFLEDPAFIQTTCKKILAFEMGEALGVKWVVSFIVASAGFTAFTLIGLDG